METEVCVQRWDRARLPVAFKTDDGFLEAPQTAVAGLGVQTYHDPEGNEILELRLPEDVFHPDSLATMKNVAMVLLHPTHAGNRVTPKNARRLSVGAGSGPTRIPHDTDERLDLLGLDLKVWVDEAIRAVERGSAAEISMGYTARLEVVPGGIYENPDSPFHGTRADFIQRDIRHNHVALEPRGRANADRPGSPVRIRLDAAGDVIYPISDSSSEGDEITMKMKKITHDGSEFEVPESFADAFEKMKKEHGDMLAKMNAKKADADTADADTARKLAELQVDKVEAERRADRAEGEKAALEAKVTGLEADLEKAKADAEAPAVEAEVEMYDLRARLIAAKVDKAEAVAMSREDAIRKVASIELPDVDLEGKTLDFVEAALTIAEGTKRKTDGAGKLAAAASTAARNDADHVSPAVSAGAAYAARLAGKKKEG